MLVTNKSNYEVGEVVSFKLVNGDEVVAKLVHNFDTEFVISNPMVAIPGQQGIGLMGAMLTAEVDANSPLAKSQVMLSYKTAEKIADHYRKLTTGIETVRNDKKIILA